MNNKSLCFLYEKRWKTKDLHFWLYLSRFDLTQNPDSVYVKCKIKLSIYQ